MKLTGITSIGTYYSPWLSYGLASFYFCDEIIVVNGGYDLRNPDKNEYNIPLEQVSKDISRLDVAGKVFEWKHWSLNDAKYHKLFYHIEKDHPLETITPSGAVWVEIRGLGLTLALEKAIDRGANWILKWDTDQVGYADCINFKKDLRSITFYQHEFVGDVIGDKYSFRDPLPATPWNDSVFSFQPRKDQYFLGGGGPMGLPHGSRAWIEDYHCAHLRNASPPRLSEAEKFAHFYGRQWFNYMTNHGLWGDELKKVAEAQASAKRTGGTLGKPPEAVLSDPLEYIREVIMKNAS